MKRLCLFTDSLEPSGMGEHMLTLAAELRHNYEVLFALPPSPSGDQLLARATALDIHCLAVVATPEQTGNDLLRDWLEQRQVDIFHSHAGIGWEGHTGIYAARSAGVPVIVRTEHLPFLITDHREYYNHRQLMQSIDRLVCVSEEALLSFVRGGVPRTKLSVVRNGVKPVKAQRTRQAVRIGLELAPKVPLVLTVGRLTPQKNHAMLVAAMQHVLARVPTAQLLIVGDGRLRIELEQVVKTHGLQSTVRMLGQRNDVADLLQAADLFVLPSEYEGLPLVLLEAMAAGLPVVGTRVCGIRETINDGITGRLVELNDVVGLAQCIVELLDNRLLARQIGAAGRQHFAQDWSAERMIAEIDEVYQQLLSQ